MGRVTALRCGHFGCDRYGDCAFAGVAYARKKVGRLHRVCLAHCIEYWREQRRLARSFYFEGGGWIYETIGQVSARGGVMNEIACGEWEYA